jgi:hypothetical protein
VTHRVGLESDRARAVILTTCSAETTGCGGQTNLEAASKGNPFGQAENLDPSRIQPYSPGSMGANVTSRPCNARIQAQPARAPRAGWEFQSPKA